ncbi:MAG: ATP-binding cassette domain-containing protein [Albidovulum sp.]|nr:ATP-binding cassette domain-containing protein [Albidovulum sp.]
MLRVCNLKTFFRIGAGLFGRKRITVKAVDDVSFEIGEGEVLGLVGESGSGKSTVGRTLTRLEKPTSGKAYFDGQDILKLSARQFRPVRRHIQMIFQDPYASLNPRLSVEATLAEPLRIHGLAGNRSEAREKIGRILERVGLEPEAMKKFPHEFSGGQRQRIGIARVMVLAPRLVIADEAVSALDSSIQAQILNLIGRLQRENNVSMLFISHDLGVVRYVCDRVAVMHRGRIVELGGKSRIFSRPEHEYTKALLGAVPRIPRFDYTGREK